jgi:hypothetical protein
MWCRIPHLRNRIEPGSVFEGVTVRGWLAYSHPAGPRHRYDGPLPLSIRKERGTFSMAEIIDSKRIQELQDREEKRLEEQTPESALLYQRAKESLVSGVASSYQMRDPYPLYRQGLPRLERRRARIQ